MFNVQLDCEQMSVGLPRRLVHANISRLTGHVPHYVTNKPTLVLLIVLD